jgi:hypothetical protein
MCQCQIYDGYPDEPRKQNRAVHKGVYDGIWVIAGEGNVVDIADEVLATAGPVTRPPCNN